MQYLALNGFRHSLRRYFNSRVTCIDKFNWTERNAKEFAATIDQPTTLIGFSDGATACLTIACHSPLITSIHCHSPLKPPSLYIVGNPYVHLYRTLGDTTPTFDDTLRIHSMIRSTLNTLNPGPHEPIRNLATLTMYWKTHQFRNCLPFLPENLLP